MYSPIDVDEMNVRSMLLINILAVNRQIPVYLFVSPLYTLRSLLKRRLGGTFLSDNNKFVVNFVNVSGGSS